MTAVGKESTQMVRDYGNQHGESNELNKRSELFDIFLRPSSCRIVQAILMMQSMSSPSMYPDPSTPRFWIFPLTKRGLLITRFPLTCDFRQVCRDQGFAGRVALSIGEIIRLPNHHPTQTIPTTMMKYCTLALALAAAPAFAGEAPAPAPAPAPVVADLADSRAGWFLGVKGSALWMDNISYTADAGLGNISIDSDFEVGWGVTVPFGYRFDNGLSLGASVGYYYADMDSVTVRYRGRELGDVNIDADPAMVPILANVAYSFGLTEALSMTLGAGLGISWHEFDLDNVEGYRYDSSSDGWDFSWQLFGGFNYSVAPSTDLTLGYRFIASDSDVDDLRGHNLEAGVVIRF
jgi:opacity protein-like surface antigen